MAKFIITRRKNSEFQFNLHAANNEIILSSEGYKQKAGCLNGIKSVVKNTSNDKMFERNISKNGKPYFNLKSSNGQVIGTSEMYESKAGMEKGIASVIKNAAVAQTINRTGLKLLAYKLLSLFKNKP